MKSHFLAITLMFGITSISQAQSTQDAIKLTDNEQYDAATEMFQNLISKDPASVINYYYLGDNYLKADNPDSAKITFNAGINKNGAFALNYVGLAKLALKKGNPEEAAGLFTQAIQKAGDKKATVMGEMAEGYIIYTYKDLNKADSLLNKAIALEPKNAEWYILLGDVFLERNLGTVAISNYNNALDMDKNAVKSIVRKGRLYKRSQNLEGAAAEFKNAIAINPDFAPAHRELGEIYFLQRNIAEAKAEYKKYLELSKNNTNARLRYASFLFVSKEYAEASKELSNIKSVDSTSIGVLRLDAYVNLETNNPTQALTSIEKLIADYGTSEKINATDYEYYGRILSKNGRDSLAIETYNKAIGMDSRKSELYNDIGNSYMKIKKFDLAEKAYRTKTESDASPNSTDYFLLGKACFYNDNYAGADTIFGKVTELQPTWPQGWLWRAQSNANIDTASTQGLAKPYYEKFMELATADSANAPKYRNGIIEANKYLGYYWFLKKDNEQSLAYWRKVLELEPNDKQAKEALKGIK